MAPDELVRLCEALIGDLDLSGARRGNGVAKGLSDEDFILLMRFMSGERMTYNVMPLENPVTPVRGQLTLVEDDDDDDPSPPNGDFSGVTLF